MFEKVLVANRGEIACRILSTLRRLGVSSVAVYSDVDARAAHVTAADEAVRIGPAPAAESYGSAPAILEAARRTGAQAIHPGYGFLSENPDFAAACEAAGFVFVGPRPEQIRNFGLKHEARRLARGAGLPLLDGTELLGSSIEALERAAEIGYPVMLKSTAGGGGIGLVRCRDAAALEAAFESVVRLSQNNFNSAGVYLEKFVEHARHVEVQIFGDGAGTVIALGERDCSVQRRNQKVVEETPAPGLDDEVRARLAGAAVDLAASVRYRSAGTVEFVVDARTQGFYFLEVNTRLQVEHCVTEEVFGLDLVEWMLRLAAGEPLELVAPEPRGHSIEVRVYAEDPGKDFRPCAGQLSLVRWPEARVETWIEAGTEVSAYYDPLLAKLVVSGATRADAVAALGTALAASRIDGIETNLRYLSQIATHEAFRVGGVTTGWLPSVEYRSRAFDVLSPGTLTTVQDFPGRTGYWDVGIPPSGAMDALALRLANRAVGNPEGTAGLEITASGPTLRFRSDALIALGGAPMPATLDDAAIDFWRPIQVRAGQTLAIGRAAVGCRAYLCVRGGLDVPEYLTSRSTFTLGCFGGHAGRALRTGDVVWIGSDSNLDAPRAVPEPLAPRYGNEWEIAVLHGPHAAPDFFTERDIETFYGTTWRVHYNSARTGVRLTGPKPEWARSDGGEAGLHPSNIHDTPYAIGAVDFTGDMPILLGPDGPSLGGFVCPATVVQAELWKLGQLRPGDGVRFRPISVEVAVELERSVDRCIATFDAAAPALPAPHRTPAVVDSMGSGDDRVVWRQAGDRNLLVEFGPPALDLRLRARVHALTEALSRRSIDGVIDLTPGIRSLQIHYDSRAIDRETLLGIVKAVQGEIAATTRTRVSTRVIRMPLSWDDPATQLAIEKYTQSVRKDAPWAPSNIEFIRRINGLVDVEAVRRIVFDARYLVLGLGDVYLGAPVATPVDPRHRLVTTKYNPARTWTPENAVGIGGAYLCIYGMEGPGGYQFVGRTVQVFNRLRQTRDFRDGKPWLLRFFDQIQFYPVGAEELLEMREAFLHGAFCLDVNHETFDLGAYEAELERNAASIAEFKARQQASFEEERQRWALAGLDRLPEADDAAMLEAPPDSESGHHVESSVSGNVWKLETAAGARVEAGSVLVVLESMKMEIAVQSPVAGVVRSVHCATGRPVNAGQTLVVIEAG